jgi:hypothetical protein
MAITKGPPSFAALTAASAVHGTDESRSQIENGARWTTRKACTALRITSSIVTALVVHPGANSPEEEIAAATAELSKRTASLTVSALEIAGMTPTSPGFADFKNRLLLQVAEAVGTQWRVEHTLGVEQLTIERVAKIFAAVMRTDPLQEPPGDNAADSEISLVLAKRLSLLAVMPSIAEAVNAFDYFSPTPDPLIRDGMREVLRASDGGVQQILGEEGGEQDRTLVTQAVIERMGDLYAANYRALARKDVIALQRMEEAARNELVADHKANGRAMDTTHIHQAFHSMAERLVKMVVDAAPEVRTPTAEAQNQQSSGVPDSGSAQRMELS